MSKLLGLLVGIVCLSYAGCIMIIALASRGA